MRDIAEEVGISKSVVHIKQKIEQEVTEPAVDQAAGRRGRLRACPSPRSLGGGTRDGAAWWR